MTELEFKKFFADKFNRFMSEIYLQDDINRVISLVDLLSLAKELNVLHDEQFMIDLYDSSTLNSILNLVNNKEIKSAENSSDIIVTGRREPIEQFIGTLDPVANYDNGSFFITFGRFTAVPANTMYNLGNYEVIQTTSVCANHVVVDKIRSFRNDVRVNNFNGDVMIRNIDKWECLFSAFNHEFVAQRTGNPSAYNDGLYVVVDNPVTSWINHRNCFVFKRDKSAPWLVIPPLIGDKLCTSNLRTDFIFDGRYWNQV